MPDETCPWCGAAALWDVSAGESETIRRFECMSRQRLQGVTVTSEEQSAPCKLLEAVTAERDELRQRIAGAPVVPLVEVGNFTIWERGNNKERVEELKRFSYEYHPRVRLVIDDQETDHA